MIIPDAVEIPVNGIYLSTIVVGPKDGNPVILLHGFPDANFGWRHQFGALLNAGCLVIAPDLRGANRSAKPLHCQDYTIAKMVEDVIGLADYLGLRDFSLVGHDFGGALAWHLTTQYSERVRQLIVLNAPHPEAFMTALESDADQQLKSSYIGVMALPWFAQLYIELTQMRPLRECLPAVDFQTLQMYEASWHQPEAVFGMTNWYRANMLHPPGRVPEINNRTTIIWGKQDHLLEHWLGVESARYCSNCDLHMIAGAGHWVQVEAAGEVNRILMEQMLSLQG